MGALSCPTCGKTTPSTIGFCKLCGAKLPAASTEPAARGAPPWRAAAVAALLIGVPAMLWAMVHFGTPFAAMPVPFQSPVATLAQTKPPEQRPTVPIGPTISQPSATDNVRTREPMATVMASPVPTTPALAPVVSQFATNPVFAGTLPVTVTLRGARLNQVKDVTLVLPDNAMAVVRIHSGTDNQLTLVITELPRSRELKATLRIDGQQQALPPLVLRDYLEVKTMKGIRPEYAARTTRIDPAGPSTRMRVTHVVESDAVGMVYQDDAVDVLRDDIVGWYLVRVFNSRDPSQNGVEGWVERWLVDDEGGPPERVATVTPRPVRFLGRLGKTPVDEAVSCGSQFQSSVYGSVERPNGSGIANAAVRVTSADRRHRFTERTRRDGTFTISGLGCTAWIIELVEVPGQSGFQANTLTIRTLNGGQFTAAEVRFRQQP